MPAAFPFVRLHELKPGDAGEFFALLHERQPGLTREGKPFFTCRFKDIRRSVSALVWGDTDWYTACDSEWRVGQFFKMRGIYRLHDRYGPQVDLSGIRPVNDKDRREGFNEIEYVDRFRRDPEACFAELRKIADDGIQDVPLRTLSLKLLDTHQPRLMLLPASPRAYYPRAGGWMEHTVNVARHSQWLCEQYRGLYAEAMPPLNADLVLAGAVLHEIGRAVELEPDPDALDRFEATVPGQLFGHLFLGRDLVREAARDIEGLDPQLLQLLEHILVTHLALPEWGSPRLPAIPEVLIIHHADDLDAKMEMYQRCLRTDASSGPFTERDAVLGRPLFKSRSI